MLKLLISYRRGDTRRETLRIYQRLCTEFGQENVAKDLRAQSPAATFQSRLAEVLVSHNLVLVVIGPDWISQRDERGNPKIRNYNDDVHVELRTALARDGITVVPILIEGAMMPSKEQLPTPLQDLVNKPALIIRKGPFFESDLDIVVDALRRTPGADQQLE